MLHLQDVPHLHQMCAGSPQRPNESIRSLELKLHMVVSCRVGAGHQTQILQISSQCSQPLNHLPSSSLILLFFFFLQFFCFIIYVYMCMCLCKYMFKEWVGALKRPEEGGRYLEARVRGISRLDSSPHWAARTLNSWAISPFTSWLPWLGFLSGVYLRMGLTDPIALSMKSFQYLQSLAQCHT